MNGIPSMLIPVVFCILPTSTYREYSFFSTKFPILLEYLTSQVQLVSCLQYLHCANARHAGCPRQCKLIVSLCSTAGLQFTRLRDASRREVHDSVCDRLSQSKASCELFLQFRSTHSAMDLVSILTAPPPDPHARAAPSRPSRSPIESQADPSPTSTHVPV